MTELRVVLVDDSSGVLRELELLVGSVPGVRVVATAADGASAIRTIDVHRPDLLVLDVRMPRVNGFRVLDAVKRMETRPIVLMLTNITARTVRERALAAGADGFFDKSTEVAALLDEIGRHVRSRQLSA
jgi:DNA-binding NarL/FixJ family response regulator